MYRISLLLVILAVAAPARAAGILAPTDVTLPPLRITDHLVDVTVRDRVALTEVTQTFHNDTNRRLEATYVFPLPEHADLTDFQMTFNGKMVKGEVLPAEEARRIYEQIVRQTRDPGLIEFIGRRLLRMRVFPIEPGQDTTIQLRYQQVTRPISGMHGYHYPLRTRKTAGQAHGMVRFTVDLTTAAPLKSIWSPSHAVEIVRKGEKAAHIAYEASGGSLEEDFLLLYDTDASDLGLSVVAYKPDESFGHFVLMLTPKQLWPKTAEQPQDVVFVIDTSGSMSGEKIDQARRALQFCIDKLGKRDRFNVVRFSTGFDVLFPGLAETTRENRAKAQEFAETFSAAGGTNISDTLSHVMTLLEEDATRPFVVVFLTDGQGNRPPDEILATLARNRTAGKRMRIFPFGVGHNVNTVLLDGLAGAYRGRPSYVQPGENLELVLGDFFSVISQPVLTNLALELPGVGVRERFPATLGDLYHGQQVIVAAQFATPMTGAVKLTATRNGEPVEYTWPDVAFVHTAEASYVPGVWAGRKIAFLIDQIRAHGESEEMIAEVVKLSQEHGIQTPYTSWLVAPEGRPVITAGVGRRGMQRERLRGHGGSFGPGGRGGGFGGGGHRMPGPPTAPSDSSIIVDGQTFFADDLERAMGESAGKVANAIARANVQLKEAVSRDGQRLREDLLATRKIDGRWYNRIGPFLVDQEFGETTEITEVRFGSDAYFDLVLGREDLRSALAASRLVVVMVAPGQAILVLDEQGLEEFSQEQVEQFRLQLR
jgi:Ca-activated chloride channel family protein